MEAKTKLIAYIDGSFNPQAKAYGAGILFIFSTHGQRKMSFRGEDMQAVALRNVAGEILAAKKAIEYAIENKYKSIDIFYDYTGIEMWATNQWKAKNMYTQEYVKFIRESEKKIDIHFHYVKGHSGNKYNETADALAKEAVGLG